MGDREPVVVRDVGASDAAAWRSLFTAYGVFYRTTFDEAVLDGVWAWLRDGAHPVDAVVAMSADGTLVGFAHYRRVDDTFTAGPGWHLDDLYVQPDARGSGAGKALVEAVAERAALRGGGTLRWITAADNETAQRLYERVATRTVWVTYERLVAARATPRPGRS